MPFSCFCIECVDTATLGIVERFGNFTNVLSPGFNLICWPIDSVVGRVSGRVQQIDCSCGTKTKDNVFVSIQVVIQYQVRTHMPTRLCCVHGARPGQFCLS